MTPLPAKVRESVESALSRLAGRSDFITSTTPVPGGCIHHGTHLTTASGASYFLKWNASAPAGIFAAEAEGLRALRRAVAASPSPTPEPGAPETNPPLLVPEPIAWIDGPPSWLLMEYVPPASSGGDSAVRLGRGLAVVHGMSGEAPFGWPAPNWIGSLEQDNTPDGDWPTFWRARRLLPQLERARRAGALADPIFDRLFESIPAALEGAGAPALLHGDLWGGNTYAAAGGVPVLIDPAVYVGDGEVDLAMTELFGGFTPAFYDAYAEIRPISAAYRSHRRDLYQLYYLLVHVNLFGAAWAAPSRRAAERVVAALR